MEFKQRRDRTSQYIASSYKFLNIRGIRWMFAKCLWKLQIPLKNKCFVWQYLMNPWITFSWSVPVLRKSGDVSFEGLIFNCCPENSCIFFPKNGWINSPWEKISLPLSYCCSILDHLEKKGMLKYSWTRVSPSICASAAINLFNGWSAPCKEKICMNSLPSG